MYHKKAQYYIVKPIALIMTIIIIFVLFYSLQNFNIGAHKDAATVDAIIDTSNTISILTNSEDCLAYNPLELGVYGSIVSTEKLDDFEKKYKNIEPECSRNHMRGWHAEVKDLMTGDKWTFGAPDYPMKIARRVLDQRKVSSMPIALRYSPTKVNPGRITVTTFAGDLERVSGFIDYVCMAGRRSFATYSDSRTFHIDYPITYENNTMCLVLGKDKICRDTYCYLFFEGIPVAGEYKISAKYMFTTDTVVVRT